MFRPAMIATVASLAFALSNVDAHAGVVIDQQDTSNTIYMAQFSQHDLAQSFTPTLANSTGAGIFLNQTYSSGTAHITIGLWTALPSAGGAMLTSGTASASTSTTWLDVSWSPVALTPAKKYYLVFTSDNSTYGIAGEYMNGYGGGEVYANAGYGQFPSYDYTFREFAQQSVPEPASLALLGAGMMGTAAIARRRKSTMTLTAQKSA